MDSAIVLAVIMTAFTGQSQSFDYARYEDTDVDTILERALAFDVHESGQSVLTPPLPVHIRATIASHPQTCSDDLPTIILRAVGVPDPPAMKWCMSVKAKSGQTVNLWVQDSLAPFIADEYELGDEMEIWALWLFVNSTDRKPYFVINAIGPAGESLSEQPDGT